jgi:hypothetical protein
LVFNHRVRVDFPSALAFLSFLFIILISFVGTVLFTVSYEIGFWLFRGELGWSRFFRVPVT